MSERERERRKRKFYLREREREEENTRVSERGIDGETQCEGVRKREINKETKSYGWITQFHLLVT